MLGPEGFLALFPIYAYSLIKGTLLSFSGSLIGLSLMPKMKSGKLCGNTTIKSVVSERKVSECTTEKGTLRIFHSSQTEECLTVKIHLIGGEICLSEKKKEKNRRM